MSEISDANWESYRIELERRCQPECVAEAKQFLMMCRAKGKTPFFTLKSWAYWHNVFDRGRMIPPGWPDALTAGDWKSLTMFAENETKGSKLCPQNPNESRTGTGCTTTSASSADATPPLGSGCTGSVPSR